RVEQAGQHLERGGLAGAVGSEEPDPLAALDPERHAVDRLDHVVAPAEHRAQRGRDAGRTAVHAEVLAEAVDGDHRRVTVAQRRHDRGRPPSPLMEVLMSKYARAWIPVLVAALAGGTAWAHHKHGPSRSDRKIVALDRDADAIEVELKEAEDEKQQIE